MTVSYIAVFSAIRAGIAFSSKNLERKFRSSKMKELEDLKDSREFQSLKDVPKLSTKMSAFDNMKTTNPDYPSDGTTSNCTFCTTTMALREKGYDVQAKKKNSRWVQ